MKQHFRLLQFGIVLSIFTLTLYAQPYGWIVSPSGTSNNLYGVSFTSPNTGTAVGLTGTILRTTNGGVNWVSQTSPNGSIHLFDTYFITDMTGWIAGDVGKIIKTTNGGSTWVNQTTPSPYQLTTLVFLDGNTGFVAGWYGTIMKTTNGGTTWTQLNTGTQRNLKGMCFVTTTLGYAVGLVGKVIRTTNAGTSWDSIMIGTSYSLENVYFSDLNNGNIIGENGTVFKTTNGGTNWSSVSFGTTSWLNDISASKQNPFEAAVIGQSGVIRKTSNAGVNWYSQVSNTSFWLHRISFSDTSNGYAVGDNGTIIHTTTGGWLPPTAPGLSAPSNNSTCFSVTGNLVWNNVAAPVATSQVQIATDTGFTNVVYNIGRVYNSTTGSTTTLAIPAGALQYNTLYYWHVKDSNQVSTGPWSTRWNFRTTFPTPAAPNQVAPANNSIGIGLNALIDWDSVANASVYRLRIATDAAFTALVLDSNNITGTQITVPNGKLNINTIYYWRVTASNTCVTSAFSPTWNFRTVQFTGISSNGGEIPKDYRLYDNYPNPFNPVTSIKFDIPHSSYVHISIFDALGRLVETAVDRKMDAGSYTYLWDASSYPSGVYFYSINSESYSTAKKMVLIK
jgi:photosystem II stability/assembly factor-like uncharacterized protein